MKFKKGDKVLIPTSKSNEVGFYSHEDFLEEIKDGNLSYLIISYSLSHNTYALRREDNKPLRANTFNENDLVPYVEETLPEEYIVDAEDHIAKVGDAFIAYTGAKQYANGETFAHAKWRYFVFDKEKKSRSDYFKTPPPTYKSHLPIIPYTKWKELYNKTNKTDMKKIIGYKFKDDKNKKAFSSSDVESWDRNVKNHGWAFIDDCLTATRFRESGLLDILFEPVYKEDKLCISIAGAKLEIGKKGVINFDFNGNKGATNISNLEGILAETSYSLKIGKFDVTSTGIHIGCSEGINLSIDEVKNIIKQYNKFK